VARPPRPGTLLAGQTAEIAINQHWVKNLRYDPEKDLLPVALAGVVPLALTVPAKAPYATMAQFFDALSKSKAPLSYASAGAGTPGYFAGEFLKLKAKRDMTHVPYKGAGPALNDLIGGHVDLYFPGFPAVVPHMKSGLLKVLAVSSAKRTPAAPDIPTVGEVMGASDFDLTLWVGFFAPRGTPADVVARLNTEINKVLAQDETRQKLLSNGADVTPMSQDQFAAFVKAESSKYLRIIKETGVTPE
jgi:tripartite-type tricarboxylate transporter receptor subunit TctC